MHDLVRPRRAPHRGDRIGVARARPVHERVDQRHEERRRGAADRDHDARRQVQPRRHPAAAVEIDAEEDRLGEEREPLQRERQPDRFAERAHEPRPQQAELERQHRPRHRADREQDAGPLGQPLRQQQVLGIARPPVAHVRDHHQRRQRDARRREHDVERQRHPHLRARVRQSVPAVGHGGILRRTSRRCYAGRRASGPPIASRRRRDRVAAVRRGVVTRVTRHVSVREDTRFCGFPRLCM